MKKILTFLFCILSNIFHVLAQKTPLLLGEAIFGKVKQITEVECTTLVKPDGTIVLDSLIKNVSEFDSLNNIKKRVVYMGTKWSGNNFYSEYTYLTKIDGNGNNIEVSLYSTFKVGRYLFNSKGGKIEFESYKSDGSVIFKDIYKYNKKDELISDRYYDGKDNLYFERRYKYDKNGNLIEDDNIQTGSSYKATYTYQSFDEAGNWTKRTYSGKFDSGLALKQRITLRQIVYYQQ